MKKSFWLLAVIVALTIENTGRTSAKCYTPDSEGDSIRIPKDSLAIMTVEELNAYYDSIYRLDHPRMQIIWNPDTSKAVNQPLRQKKVFSYSNSYVPNSVTLDTSNAVGEIEIQGNISPSGAKTYTVPIRAYKHEGAFCPDVSLTYNSQGGGSAYGKGWSIGGLQIITRGNKTIYFDGETEGIKMDADDVFYLNGVRLIRTSTSAYEYETEQGKIKAIATVDGNVVKYFNVYFPNGYTAVFGFTTSTTNGVEYPITSLSDERGRNIIYSYVSSAPHCISTIWYDNYSARIDFSYDQNRADHVQGYRAGKLLDSRYLLKSISCKKGSFEIGTYTLTYKTDANTSLLEKIELSSNNTSLNPLRFYYGDNSAIPSFETSPVSLYGGYVYQERSAMKAVRGRFDYTTGSDGILFFPNAEPYYHIEQDATLFHHSRNYLNNVYNSSEDTLFIYNHLNPDIPHNNVYNIPLGSNFIEALTANLDGDRDECIIKVNNKALGSYDILTFTVYWNTLSGITQRYERNFYYSTVYVDNDGNRSIMPKYYYTGDFNGDGKMEVMAITPTNPFGENNSPSMCYIYDLNGYSTIYSNHLFDYNKVLAGNHYDALSAEWASDKIFTIDYNGDGKTDLCHVSSSGMDIYEFSQNGNTLSAQCVATYTPLTVSSLAHKRVCLGDFNSDGLTDFLVSSLTTSYGDSTWYFHFSKGDGSFAMAMTTQGPNTQATTSDFFSQDIDSDGVTDLVELTDNNFKCYMVKNNQLTLGVTKTLSHPKELIVPVNINSTSLSTQFVSLLGIDATLYSYKTNQRTDQALTGVVNSNGVIEKNYYYTINNDNYGIYSIGDDNAPNQYTKIFEAIPVVAGDQLFSNGSKERNKYQYTGGVIHRQGLGFCGFETISVTDKTDQTSTSTYDPYQHSVLVQTDTPTERVDYTNTVSCDSYKRVKKLVTQKGVTDKLRNIPITTTYTYDNIYDLLQTENTTYPGSINVNKTYTYTNFDNISSKYHLGRPASTTTTTTRGSSQHSEQTLYTSYNTYDEPLTIVNKINSNVVRTTNFVYDSNGNMTSQSVYPYSSSTPRTSNYQYDYYNRLTKATDPLGVWKEFTYNTDGTIASTRTYIGYTNYTYDAFGRQISETRPDTVTISTSFTWNTDNGGLYAVTKSGTNMPTETTIYDALNREVRQQQTRFDGNLLKVDKQYDTYGNLWKESYPYKTGSPTYMQYTYDSYNRLITKSEIGKTTNYSYSGLSTTVNDGTMSTTTTTDALGGVVSVTDPAGTINYTLNGAGNPTSISAPSSSGNGITTSVTYDTYGRRTSIIDPSSGTTTYSYHSTEGYLQSETNSKGQTTSYVCDIHGRTTQKISPEFSTTYTYNNNLNKITAETCNNGTSTTYTYDVLGRLSSTTENAVDNKWLQREYTYSNGQVSAIKYTSQNGILTTENHYYTNSHLTSVKLNGTTTIFSITSENNQGRVAYMGTGGISRNYGYTVSGYPTSRAVTAFGPTKQFIQYSFNEQTGNLESRSYPLVNMTETFSYDNLNRLTSFGSHGVTYDNNGNIISKGDVGSFNYNTSGKPYAVSDVTLTNSISVGTQNVSYYSFDRPNEISDNGYTATFTYNGNYDRVKMAMLHNSSASLTRYYLGGCYELDVKPSGTTERLYLNGGYYDAPTVLIKQGNTSSVYHILRNHLGSITHVLNSSGTVVQELSYDAWGRLRNPSTFALYTPTNEPEPYLGRGYCGHEHLTGLGLINMNARLYDPLLGRFLSPDPYVQAPEFSQSFNRYSYCMNNPLKFNDRTGEIIGIDDLIIIAGVVVGAYLGGAVANNNQWNPAKWNYSSFWTYAGIVGGGVLGGYAGSAIAAGNLTLSLGAITPIGVIGVNNWKDRNNNRRTDFEINTIAGGHWNSGEEKGIKNAEESYDKAVGSMFERYQRGVERNLDTNPNLNNLYYSIRYGAGWSQNSLNTLSKFSSRPEIFSSSIKQIKRFNYGYQFEELMRDYIKDGGFGYNFWNDVRIDAGSWAGGYVGASIGSVFGPIGAIVGYGLGSFYIDMHIRHNIYENYIYNISPDINNWDNYYNFYMMPY